MKKLLYIKIADEIIADIVSGNVKPGDKLESVREMSVRLKVNPKTVQRSFKYLEELEVFNVATGDGRYITDNQAVIDRLREYMMEEEIKNFIKSMEKYNVSPEDLAELIIRKGKE